MKLKSFMPYKANYVPRQSSVPGSGAQLEVQPIGLVEARKLRPIDSGFQTDRVLRLHREDHSGGYSWRLTEEWLPSPYRKRYDTGKLDEWLRLYADAASSEGFRFAVANMDGESQGLLTWRHMEWNDTLWLVDIRVRPEARQLGVGSVLVEFLKQTTRRRKGRGISVETQINNYPGLCFYRKQGFVIVGFNDHLYTNDDLKRQDVALFLFWEVD